MRLDHTDFELFDLAPRFAQERATLDARWKALQAKVHPDNFATEGAAAQRMALQWTIRVNEAYQRLKDPLARATYLCQLHGHEVHAESNTAMPAGFLLQQMAWRDSLEGAQTPERLEALLSEVREQQHRLQSEMAASMDLRQDWPAATDHVRTLMFVTRFARDADQRLVDLMDMESTGPK